MEMIGLKSRRGEMRKLVLINIEIMLKAFEIERNSWDELEFFAISNFSVEENCEILKKLKEFHEL